MTLLQATTPAHFALARGLFEEYAAWLGVDLCFQGFAAELAGLPGAYALPQGRLLLTLEDGEAAGCVALRPLPDGFCEMKRLYVRPQFRGLHLGRQLAERIVQEARTIGYRAMRLDTLAYMDTAIRLYQSLGFTRCAAYYDTPLTESVFMELQLGAPPAGVNPSY